MGLLDSMVLNDNLTAVVCVHVGYHEFHVILDSVGPDGLWVGVAPPNMDPNAVVGDVGAGWALHTDGDKRHNGKEEEYAAPLRNGDVLTVSLDVRKVCVHPVTLGRASCLRGCLGCT